VILTVKAIRLKLRSIHRYGYWHFRWAFYCCAFGCQTQNPQQTRRKNKRKLNLSHGVPSTVAVLAQKRLRLLNCPWRIYFLEIMIYKVSSQLHSPLPFKAAKARKIPHVKSLPDLKYTPIHNFLFLFLSIDPNF